MNTLLIIFAVLGAVGLCGCIGWTLLQWVSFYFRDPDDEPWGPWSYVEIGFIAVVLAVATGGVVGALMVALYVWHV